MFIEWYEAFLVCGVEWEKPSLYCMQLLCFLLSVLAHSSEIATIDVTEGIDTLFQVKLVTTTPYKSLFRLLRLSFVR